jgi:hypothetical protein
MRALFRRRTTFALPLLLLAGMQQAVAAELPNAPAPQFAQASAAIPTTSLTGFIADSDNASIPSARVVLTQPNLPAAETTTTPDGQFNFPTVAPGPFTLAISAAGFAPTQTSGTLTLGESRDLATIVLAAATTTDVSVTASRTDIAEAQINLQEKQRVLGVFPNFYVSYISNPEPLDAKQKYELALRTMVDPISFVLNGVTAGIQQADSIYSWGEGAQGFGKRYAASYGTFLTGTLLGNAVLPTLFRQDPRYFYKGSGTVKARILYALANAVICKGDNHHWQFDYSGILGGAMSYGLSNAYYPAPNRSGIRLIVEGTAIGIGVAGIQNIIQEFLVRKLTPHTHPTTTTQP